MLLQIQGGAQQGHGFFLSGPVVGMPGVALAM